MRFYTLTEKRPEAEQLVLLKLKPSSYSWIPNYYVCRYSPRSIYELPVIYEFVEASGEQYMIYEENEILGWMPLSDLNGIPYPISE